MVITLVKSLSDVQFIIPRTPRNVISFILQLYEVVWSAASLSSKSVRLQFHVKVARF